MTKQPSSGETSAVVTDVHRYKPPPRKKQAAPLPGPAVVTKRARPRKAGPTAAVATPLPANDDRKPQSGSTNRHHDEPEAAEAGAGGAAGEGR